MYRYLVRSNEATNGRRRRDRKTRMQYAQRPLGRDSAELRDGQKAIPGDIAAKIFQILLNRLGSGVQRHQARMRLEKRRQRKDETKNNTLSDLETLRRRTQPDELQRLLTLLQVWCCDHDFINIAHYEVSILCGGIAHREQAWLQSLSLTYSGAWSISVPIKVTELHQLSADFQAAVTVT